MGYFGHSHRFPSTWTFVLFGAVGAAMILSDYNIGKQHYEHAHRYYRSDANEWQQTGTSTVHKAYIEGPAGMGGFF